LEHFPNKKLGQNFLVDGNIVRKSIELAALTPGSTVVEVGPGLGTLTTAILKTGASVWAVERDSTLVSHLRSQISSDALPFYLLDGDCLNDPLAELPREVASKGFKIVANLPYAVSTPWMEAVLAGELPERMVLMLQKEAAERYAAGHGRKTFGAISIFLQSAFVVKSKHLVAAQCFHPAPKVDSVLLCLDRKPGAIRFSPDARDCIRRIFTQRRKQLGSLCKRDTEPRAAAWFEGLLALGIHPTIRPEELPIEHWQDLARQIAP
jgi:16S rRNA (adenine1518-N6/adenine1519-N6)-dimethyltransferase